MINFKLFVGAIHDAILKANESLMDKNEALLDKYFTKVTKESPDEKGNMTQKTVLEPKTVTLDYPSLDEEGNVNSSEIRVPLITLVPLSTSQIEKAVLTADFEMRIVDDELQVDFSRKQSSGGLFKKSEPSKGNLEITITPQETTEGLKLLIDGYEMLLRRQIP